MVSSKSHQGNKQQKTAVVVICDTKNDSGGPKILMVHQALSNKWSVTKGQKDKYESWCRCGFREVQEETGLCLQDFKFSLRLSRFINRFNTRYYVVNLQTNYFPKTKIQDKHEIDEIRWVGISELPSLAMGRLTETILRELNFL